MANPFIPFRAALVNLGTGKVDDALWQDFFRSLRTDVDTLEREVSATIGVNYKTVAQLNALSLGVDDTGYTAYVTTYQHLVYWTGTAWDWLDGDRPGRFESRAIAPGTGFQLCDGTITSYLAVGATLTEPAFTTPDVNGTASYLKSAAAYTGTLVAAGGVSASDGAHTHTVSGSTANESAHTHDLSAVTMSDPSQTFFVDNDLLASSRLVAGDSHTHLLTSASGAGSAHSHGAGSLAGDSNGAHTHAAGTIDPAHLNVLMFFRR